MWVKICGTTNREDALLAADAGADALGFIFAESPRRIAIERAREIVDALPREIEKIGVFVNAPAEEIARVVEQVGLTGIQLHGDEPAGAVKEVAREGLTVIKTMSAAQLAAVADAMGALAGEGAGAVALPEGMDALLIDSAAGRGGTGVAFAWQETREAVRFLRENIRIIVAGGLTPGNVHEAIRVLEPWGVDVVSGVEREAGMKNAEKVRAFVRNAKGI